MSNKRVHKSLDFEKINGDTRLHLAVQKKDIQEIKRWLENGEDLLEKNYDGETPFDLMSENTKCEITRSRNMPGDGNCMFWSIFFAYVTAVKDDESELTTRLKKCSDEKADLNILNKVAKAYNPFDYTIMKRTYLLEHVIKPFRKKAVEYMRQNEEKYKPFIEDNFEIYLSEMGKSRWGDQVAIKAICEMLKCSITVISNKTSFLHGIRFKNVQLKLYHSFSHYEFAVDPKIISTYYKKDTIDTSGFVPRLKRIKRDLNEEIKSNDKEKWLVNIRDMREELIEYRDENKNTLLHLIVQRGEITILKLLLENKIYDDIDKRNKLGKTPLYFAYLLKKEDMIKCLEDSNAKKDVKDDCEVTPQQIGSYVNS